MKLGKLTARIFDLPSARDHVGELALLPDCRYALDVGCGRYSHFTAFRPKLFTVGVDAFPPAVEVSKAHGLHDAYALSDILRDDPSRLTSLIGGSKYDIVGLFGLIEHVPKRQGYELLEKCESLSSKFVVLETPNGFLEQGPEYGNEFQRHLSGWFPHDFEGLGYKVYGTTGTRHLRGYASGPKYNFPGCNSLDILLSRMLRSDRHPRHAFNLIAVKDVRGVAARLTKKFD